MANTKAETRLLDRFKQLVKVKTQASKIIAKRASEIDKGIKRASEQEDEDARKQRLKLALEESRKRKAEKEKEYKNFQEALKAKTRPRSLSQQARGSDDAADKEKLKGEDGGAQSTVNEQFRPPQWNYQQQNRRGPPDRPLEYYLQTVFVGDLPDPVDQNELYRLYQQYGQIIEFKVIANRRLAFVTYDNHSSVAQAIQATHNIMFNGFRLRVHRAKVPPQLRAQEAAYYTALRHAQTQHQPMQVFVPQSDSSATASEAPESGPNEQQSEDGDAAVSNDPPSGSGRVPPETWTDQDGLAAAMDTDGKEEHVEKEASGGRGSVVYDDL